jgi:hypothetical protein
MTTHVQDTTGNIVEVLTGVLGNSKIASGTPAVTGSLAVTTGLTTILGFSVAPYAATASTANAGCSVSASVAAGVLTIRRWKHTGATTTTLITATAAGTVTWVAVGT